jgi:hypothetical protein
MPFIDPTPVMTHTLPWSFPARGVVVSWDWIICNLSAVRFANSSGPTAGGGRAVGEVRLGLVGASGIVGMDAIVVVVSSVPGRVLKQAGCPKP